jgi:hypothetical protein
MYSITTKHTRPSTDVEFYTFKESTLIPPDVKNHFLLTYVRSGNIIFTNWTEAEDGLSTVSQSLWLNKEAYDAYKNDPILTSSYFPARDAYCTTNNITMEQLGAEEI